MGKKYCWKEHPTHRGKHCTLPPGHKGCCRVILNVVSWFGAGACRICGGKNLERQTKDLWKCGDCGNKQTWDGE